MRGLGAIKAWRTETGRKYDHTIEPLAVADQDGQVLVTCKVTGNFPGSPINLDHIFKIEGDRIVALEIK
ncbi:MAG: hypothetical protein IT540_01565 [Hyphomicrobium sp.]|nr:hypothetical protein [Hyphomicrobium sp.]